MVTGGDILAHHGLGFGVHPVGSAHTHGRETELICPLLQRRVGQAFAYSPISCFAICHIAIPALTETLKECLVPNCGISIAPSEASTTS